MKKIPHSLLCRKMIPTNLHWCDYCYNNAHLLVKSLEITLEKTRTLNSNRFDDIILSIPPKNQHWLYSLQYLKNEYSVALYHRDVGSARARNRIVYESILKRANNLAIHFVEWDIELIRKFSIAAVKSLIRTINPDFIFTPEIGLKIPAKTINKLQTMLSYATQIGQEVPICFLFPGHTLKELKYIQEELKSLEPAAVGIYAGNSKFNLLCENVETIKDFYPKIPFYIVNISNPSKIKILFEKGATHFCINGWGRIGPKLRALDIELGKWTYDIASIINDCDCDACSQYEFFKSKKKLLGSKNAENLTITLHNVLGFRKIINNLKR